LRSKLPRDPRPHRRERQLLPTRTPVEAQHMCAVTRHHRNRADLAFLKRKYKCFDLRYQLTAAELPKASAVRRRRTGRARARKFVEPPGIIGEFAQRLGSRGLRRPARDIVVGRGEKQDVRRLVNIGRAEARAVGRPVAPAGRLVGLGGGDLARQQGTDGRFLFRLVGLRFGNDAMPRCLFQQQGADYQRGRRLLPGLRNVRRRVVLQLRGDRSRRDFGAVDDDRLHHRRPGAAAPPRRRTT
jgi:hypothetical protein